MGLLNILDKQLQESMKNKDEVRSSTIKMLKSDIMYEKGKTGEDLNDDQILTIITRAGKKRKDAISEYTKADRTELADKEAAELKIIEEYLPEQMGEDDIEKIISEKLKDFGEVTKADFGKVMGPIMKELKGKADGAIVKKILSQKLESK